MKWLSRGGFVVVALLVVGLGVVAVPASAAAANFQIPITPFTNDACTGEGVTLEGNLHLLVQTTANADGSFHVMQHTNTQGVSGIGVLSGDTYSFSEGYLERDTFDAQGGTTTHTVMHLEFIHHGESLGLLAPSLDDLHQHFNVATTLAPTGEPTATIHTDRFECR